MALPAYWRAEMRAADGRDQSAVAAEVQKKRNANYFVVLADMTAVSDNDADSAAKFAPADWAEEPLHLSMSEEIR